MPSIQILVSNAILQKKEPGRLGERSDSTAGNNIMSLEHLVPESKELLPKTPTHIDGSMSKSTELTERAPSGQS